jgi:hypothetical protein
VWLWLWPYTSTHRQHSMQNVERRQFVQLGFLDNQRETAIAASDRMADSVTLMGIEKEHLVRFRHSLIMPNVAHVYTAIQIEPTEDSSSIAMPN